MLDTDVITSTVNTREFSIAAFAVDAGLSVGIALSGTSLLFFTCNFSYTKIFYTIKQDKHGAIKLFAQSTLDSIANIISQTMQDGDIFSVEFHKVLKQVEKYLKLKTDIRT